MSFVLERPEDIPLDQTWGVGYDGRFSYAIAVDPFSLSDSIDNHAYRYMRIVYPMSVYALAFGQDAIIPWTLILVNLVAAYISTWLLASLLIERGAPAWPALILLLSFVYFIGPRLDLNEPLAFCLTLLGLYAYDRKKFNISLAAFVLAALTKEVTLVFPLAISAAEFVNTRRIRALAMGGVPIAAYLLWAQILTLWLGESPFGFVSLILLPFAGMVELVGFESRLIVTLWVVGPAAVFGAITLIEMVFHRFHIPTEAWLVLANAALIATLPGVTWFDPLAVLRMGVGLLIAVLLYLSVRWQRGLLFAAALWGPSILIAFLLPGFIF